ncbi:MAG: uracil phosphoribosyltransferase [Clostridium sp.]|nr:uracil phosphoribosyltransferase [Clostridium sp.]
MGRLIEVDHPLVLHKLAIIRNEKTGSKDFREVVEELSTLLAYEVTRELPVEDIDVQTPVSMAKCKTISGKKQAIVPILRAGLGMVDGMLKLNPAAKVGHIGLYRDEKTLKPVEYFCKLPNDIEERKVIVVDPMLATGGSAVDAITMLKKRGATSINFVCIVAAPEGIEHLRQVHPDVDIYVASIDEKLNEHGYIVPGLGDAGDRLFGTK